MFKSTKCGRRFEVFRMTFLNQLFLPFFLSTINNFHKFIGFRVINKLFKIASSM